MNHADRRGWRRARQRAIRALAVLALLTTFLCPTNGAAQGVAPQNDGSSTTYKIAGSVVNSVTGAPVGEARVSLVDTKTRKSVAQQKTPEGGQFEFAGLPAGKFSLEGSKQGYISGSYEQHEQYSTAIVTGPELKTEGLVLRLDPVALIGGHVRDENGDAVRRAQVTLFREDHRGGLNRVNRLLVAISDDLGYFDFSSLIPGTYFVSVNTKPWYAVYAPSTQTVGDTGRSGVSAALDAAYSTTYYSNATEAAGATPIVVKAGEHPEIEIQMSPVPALHILIRTPDEGPNGFPQPQLKKQVFDWGQPVQTGGMQSVEPGVYELVGVPPGKYSVRMNPVGPGETTVTSEINFTRDGQEVDTSRGEPLSNVKVTLKTEGGEGLPKQFVVLLQDSRKRIIAGKQADPSGQVEFEGIAPGKYAIFCNSPGKAYVVTRISSASLNSAGHDLAIQAGVQPELTAWLTEGVVKLEGVAQKAGKRFSGAMVVLIPKDPESHQEYFRRDQSDSDGTFTVADIVPGTYTIVAVEDAWGVEWLQPGVLSRYARQGQELTIGPLMRGAVHLPDPVEVQPK